MLITCPNCGENTESGVCPYCPIDQASLEKLIAPDVVNHPPHYTHAKIEVIDVIEAFDPPYHLGNVLKYVLRHKHKGGMEDLCKARWYLDRYIEKVGGGSSNTGAKNQSGSQQ